LANKESIETELGTARRRLTVTPRKGESRFSGGGRARLHGPTSGP
jgi:hypothetical protein